MVDAKKTVVTQLKTVGTTYYELNVDSNVSYPCITYLESGNASDKVGDVHESSYIDFTIKVWAKDLTNLESYALSIDTKMKSIGFKRISSNEITYNEDIICKVMIYEGLGME